MDKFIKDRFDKLDKRLDKSDERMNQHSNHDHHIIIKRFENIDKSIAHLNSKRVGYAGLVTSVLTILAILLR